MAGCKRPVHTAHAPTTPDDQSSIRTSKQDCCLIQRKREKRTQTSGWKNIVGRGLEAGGHSATQDEMNQSMSQECVGDLEMAACHQQSQPARAANPFIKKVRQHNRLNPTRKQANHPTKKLLRGAETTCNRCETIPRGPENVMRLRGGAHGCGKTEKLEMLPDATHADRSCHSRFRVNGWRHNLLVKVSGLGIHLKRGSGDGNGASAAGNMLQKGSPERNSPQKRSENARKNVPTASHGWCESTEDKVTVHSLKTAGSRRVCAPRPFAFRSLCHYRMAAPALYRCT